MVKKKNKQTKKKKQWNKQNPNDQKQKIRLFWPGVEPRTYNIQDYPLDECVISPSVKHFN